VPGEPVCGVAVGVVAADVVAHGRVEVGVSFGLSIAAGAGWLNERRRTKSEREELRRVRARLKQLESTVEEYERSLED
jgi:hypothetical protein